MADPVNLAASIASLVHVTYKLAEKLKDLSNSNDSGPASREFAIFSRELQAFASLWLATEPIIGGEEQVLSIDCLTGLRRMREDTTVAVERIEGSIARFARKERIHRPGGNWEALAFLLRTRDPITEARERNRRRLKKYFRRPEIAGLRSELDYSRKSLTLVLSVVNHARNTHTQRFDRPARGRPEFLLLHTQSALQVARRHAPEPARWFPDIESLSPNNPCAESFEDLVGRWTVAPFAEPQNARRGHQSLGPEAARLVSENERLRGQLEQLRAQLNERTHAMAQLQEEREQIATDRDAALARMDREAERADDLEDHNRRLSDSLRQSEHDVRGREREENDYRRTIERLRDDLGRSQRDLQATEQDLQSAEQELRTTRHDFRRCRHELRRSKRDRSELEQDVAHLEDALRRRLMSIDDLNEHVGRLQTQVRRRRARRRRRH